MAKRGWWGSVAEAQARDETPRIVLLRSAKVIIPKRVRGRPRKYPVGAPHPKHGHHRMQTPNGYALRCRWRGCRNFIPLNRDALTCSERCNCLLREFIELTLDVLNGKMPATEYPAHYRSRRLI